MSTALSIIDERIFRISKFVCELSKAMSRSGCGHRRREIASRIGSSSPHVACLPVIQFGGAPEGADFLGRYLVDGCMTIFMKATMTDILAGERNAGWWR